MGLAGEGGRVGGRGLMVELMGVLMRGHRGGREVSDGCVNCVVQRQVIQDAV